MSPSSSNKREDENQHQESGKDHPQVDEEIPQHIVVEQGGKAGAKDAAPGGGAFESILAASA